MGTVLVLAILAAVTGLIVRSMVKDKKNGGACGSCSGCSSCHMHGQCPSSEHK